MTPRDICEKAAFAAFLQIHDTAVALKEQLERSHSWQETATVIFECDDDCDQKVLVRLSDGRIVQSNVDRKIGRTA